MCGLAGIVRTQPGSVSAWLRSTAATLRHRGPDDEGYWLLDGAGSARHWAGADTPYEVGLDPLPDRADTRVGLVHRRLAIIDPSARGHQPMATPDGLTLVFNGEVYNHVELRRELEGVGVRFHSGSDTEVVLAAYAQWGTAAFSRFVGMWALAIVDQKRDVLILSRDPFGVKPLYVAFSPDELAFASEISPLLKRDWVDAAPDLERAAHFLLRGRSEDELQTFHAGVEQVPSASYLEVPLDLSSAPVQHRFWRLDPEVGHDLTFRESVEQVRAAFVASVELHLRSDVPVGACLSGGVDSSAIVCAMREIGGPALDLHTFSYVSSDPATSEERWVDMVNEHVRATSHVVTPDPSDFGRDLPQLTAAQHEPFLSTSVYAQYRVFEAARSAGVTVLLDGQGADELLAGYRGYRSALLQDAVRAGSLGPALAIAFGLVRTSSTGHNDLAEVVRAAFRRVRSRRAAPARRPTELSAGRKARVAGSLRAMLIDAAEVSSLPTLLRYEDRNSMAHSVESRVPFLTTEFAELVIGMPDSHLVSRGGVTKRVFREAMRGIVPDPILDRRDKIGFSPTQSLWLAHAPLSPLPAAPESLLALVPPDLDARIRELTPDHDDPEAWRAWSLLNWGSSHC